MLNNPKPLRCVIYIRVSSQEQVEGHSLDAQRDLCIKFAEARGWEVIRLFEGEGESAKNDKRRAFQEAVAYLRTAQADVFLTQKVDRFARNVVDALTYLHEFQKIGVTYCSVSEPLDFTTPIGRMMFIQFATFAEYFLVNLSAETKKGKRTRAEKGFWNGDLPYGYRLAADGLHAELNPQAAPVVQLAFETYASGQHSSLQIAQMLNQRGHKMISKRGAVLFSKDTTEAMLSNPFYTGVVTYKGEAFPGRHPALISSELFERCKAVRLRRRSYPKVANPNTRIYPLARLVHCAHCGRPMRAQTNTRKGQRYFRDTDFEHGGSCPHRFVRAEVIEQQILELLGNFPAEWQTHWLTQIDGKKQVKALERRRKHLEDKALRIKHAYTEGVFSLDELKQKLAEVQAELDALRPVSPPNLQLAAERLKNLPRLWRDAPDSHKQKLAQALLERVFIRGDKVEAIQPQPETYTLLACRLLRTRRASSSEPTTHEFEHFSADGIVIFSPATPILAAVAALA